MRSENREGSRTGSCEFGPRNPKGEWIRCRAERSGGCIELKTVTEVGWGCGCDAFVTKCVDLELYALLDGEPVERPKEGSNVVGFAFLEDQACCTVLNALKGKNR